jgi:hypothetical protein
MLQNITQRNKVIIACVAIISLIFVVVLSVDLPERPLGWAFAAGTAVLILIFELYIYLSYISIHYEHRFVHIYLRINGVSSHNKIFADIDGKCRYSYNGQYIGAMKIRNGTHLLTFRSDSFSVSTMVEIKEKMEIKVDIDGSSANVHIGQKEINETEEENAARMRKYRNINMFLFVITNFLMVCAVLRFLAIFDII